MSSSSTLKNLRKWIALGIVIILLANFLLFVIGKLAPIFFWLILILLYLAYRLGKGYLS